MMMKKIYLLLLLIPCLFACSSEGLLDTTDTGSLEEANIYQNRDRTREVLNFLYGSTRLANMFSPVISAEGLAYLDITTDLGKMGGSYDGTLPFTQGTMVASSTAPLPNDPWKYYYIAIHMANSFLANVDKSPLTDEEKRDMKLEARFLRAVYYFELFRWCGPFVITTDILDPFDFSQKRADIDASINFIVKELDEIAPQMRPEWTGSDYGRATKGAAMAYKAKTLLYAASPLSNPSNDKKKWENAVKALKDVIDLDRYSLYYDADKRELSYARLFNQRVADEIIYSYLRGNTTSQYGNLPSGDPWTGGTTYAASMPTQNLVDAYDMLDGSEPVDIFSPNYRSGNRSATINSSLGYDDSNPYVNRDPRLEMTVLHHGSTWLTNKQTATLDLKKLSVNDAKTGYILRKFLDDRIDHRNGGTTQLNFPMMRYADILLSYAEAKNEYEGPGKEILDIINLVRERAGVGLLNTDPSKWNYESLKKRIIKERMVEFAYEEHRFFDVRRWKRGDFLSGKIYKIGLLNDKMHVTELESRSFPEKMYLLPVPLAETQNSPGIYQNPNW